MSWQAYVDTSLVGTGNIDKAAIFNKEGTSVWASSPGFTVAPAEIREVVAAYDDTSDVKQVQSNGLRIAGERYVVIKADGRSLYGKKGKEGILVVKTTLAILVTHYPETVQPGNAVTTVEGLADYLLSVGLFLSACHSYPERNETRTRTLPFCRTFAHTSLNAKPDLLGARQGTSQSHTHPPSSTQPDTTPLHPLPSNRQFSATPPDPDPLQQPPQNAPHNRHIPYKPRQRPQEIAKQHEDAVPLHQKAAQRPAQQDEQDAGQEGGRAAPFRAAREEGEGFARAQD